MRRDEVLWVFGVAEFVAVPPRSIRAHARDTIGDRARRLWTLLVRRTDSETVNALLNDTLTTINSAEYGRCMIDALIITDLLMTLEFPYDTRLNARFNDQMELCAGVRWKIDSEHVGQVIGRTRVKEDKPPVVESAVVPAEWAKNNPEFYVYRRTQV